MPKPIFKGFVFAFTGPQEQPLDKVRNWIELRKGTISEEFNGTVTHLITNKTQLLDKNNALVQKALTERPKNLVFVDWSWLVQCCDQERKLSHKGFCQFEVCKKQQIAKRAEGRRKQEKRLAENGNWVDQSLFHVYRNADAFQYDISLTRPTDTDEEVYSTYIFESNASPSLFVSAIKLYSKRKGSDSVMRPAGITKRHVLSKCRHGNKLTEAYGRFTKFFERKTGHAWDRRDEMDRRGMEADMFKYNPPSTKNTADKKVADNACSVGAADSMCGAHEPQLTQEDQDAIKSLCGLRHAFEDLVPSSANHLTEEA